MALPYTNNKPLADDKLKDSQPVIKQNFDSLKTFLELNHQEFDSALAGKHKFISLPRVSAAPVAAADELVLYTKEEAGTTELFYRRDASATERKITSTSGGAGATNWTLLPNGNVMKWAEVSGNGLASFALGAPALATRYSTQVTALRSSGADNDISVIAIQEVTAATNPNQLTVYCSNRAGTAKTVWFSYIVIGEKA